MIMFINSNNDTGKKELAHMILAWNTALEACQLNPELSLRNNVLPEREYTINVDYRNTLLIKKSVNLDRLILRQLQFEGNDKYKYYVFVLTPDESKKMKSYYDATKMVLDNNKISLVF